MKLLSWNCRAVKSTTTLTVPYLRWLCKIFMPDVIFLSETKTNVMDLKPIFNSLGFTNFSGFDAVGLSGGLVLA